MDRKLRAASNPSSGRNRWTRAIAVSLAVAGAGLAMWAADPTPAAAQQASGHSMSVPLAPDAPDTYVVKKGDSLWKVAGKVYRIGGPALHHDHVLHAAHARARQVGQV